MTRTIISLDEADKSWLDKRSGETGRPKAEIIREAIRRLRAEEEDAFDKVAFVLCPYGAGSSSLNRSS